MFKTGNILFMAKGLLPGTSLFDGDHWNLDMTNVIILGNFLNKKNLNKFMF